MRYTQLIHSVAPTWQRTESLRHKFVHSRAKMSGAATPGRAATLGPAKGAGQAQPGAGNSELRGPGHPSRRTAPAVVVEVAMPGA